MQNSAPARSGLLPWVIGIVAVLALVAGAVLYWPRAAPEKKALDLPASRPASTPAVEAQPPIAPLQRDPPKPAEIDAMLGSISKAPDWAKWLAEGDAIRRWAIVLDNLAEDVTPRKQLGFLTLPGKFTAETVDGHLVPTQAEQDRYDGFVAVISAVDVQAFAKAYRALHPALEATWRGLGYPDRSVDRRAEEALRRIIDAPSPPSVDLIAAGPTFVFADPELEALGPVEKHLLRMGRKNQRAIQQKARELLSALSLSAAVHK